MILIESLLLDRYIMLYLIKYIIAFLSVSIESLICPRPALQSSQSNPRILLVA